MWLAPIFPMLALSLPGAGLDAASSGPASLPPLQVTRQLGFAIPFRADTRAAGPNRPVEVQLYVSTDRGRTWPLAQKADPRSGQFLFRAGGEGEYWFLVRTRNAAGHVLPNARPEPELRVVVDTTEPRMALDTRRSRDGQVSVTWQVSEPYLEPDSLRIHYQAGSDPAWHPVVIDPRTTHLSGAAYYGEVSLPMSAASGHVQIRAEVADRAKNRAVAHAQVEAPPMAERTARRSAPGEPSWYAVDRRAEQQAAYDHVRSDEPSSPTRHDGWERSLEARVHPPVGNPYRTAAQPANRFAEWGLPPGQRPRIINKRLFELEYNDRQASAAGVSRVELWGTRDNGRIWKSYATDNDTRTPLLVSLDDEGLYGFRVVMQTANGQGDRPPIEGDVPELWVGVDLTEPQASITSARQGVGDRANELTITWTAGDWLLAERPISLYWSDHTNGPWAPIVEDLEDTGAYVWRLDTRGPEQFYLRLVVRDEAGNVATDVSELVFVRRLLSSNRIRDIRPVTYTTTRPLPHRLR